LIIHQTGKDEEKRGGGVVVVVVGRRRRRRGEFWESPFYSVVIPWMADNESN
jgi:hypothetical protein